MVYLYWILFFLKNFHDYGKIDVRIKILKCHKLNPPPPKIVVKFSFPKSIYQWSLIDDFENLYEAAIFISLAAIFLSACFHIHTKLFAYSRYVPHSKWLNSVHSSKSIKSFFFHARFVVWSYLNLFSIIINPLYATICFL